jgi:hypothetical protein
MWAANSKPTGAHVMPPRALDVGHGITGFNVCPAGFRSCLGSILPFYALIPSFENGNVYPVPLYVVRMQLIFDIMEAYS